MEKINARWEYGILVGVRRRSGELWVSIKDKVIAVRSVRRIPKEERWGEDCVKWVKRVLWNRYKGDDFADGDVPEELKVDPPTAPEVIPRGPIIIETRARAPREFYIRKEDAEKHGYTRGCGGCSSWFRGLGRQPHSEECRNRFRELLKDEARVVNAEERKKDFETNELEKRRRKEEKGGKEAGKGGGEDKN